MFEHFKTGFAWHAQVENEHIRDRMGLPIMIPTFALEIIDYLLPRREDLQKLRPCALAEGSLEKSDVIGRIVRDQDSIGVPGHGLSSGTLWRNRPLRYQGFPENAPALGEEFAC